MPAKPKTTSKTAAKKPAKPSKPATPTKAAKPAKPAKRKRLGASADHPEHVLVTQQRMQAWRSRQALVGVWTVNDEARARELSHLGVDYLVSDRPGAILKALGPG